MLSSICVATTTGLPSSRARRDDLLLQRRHLLGRKLDAKIAARNHHRIGQRDDVVEPLDRRRFLDLGQQRRPVADQRARLVDVLGPLDEADSAIQSAPCSSANWRSSRSFSVSAGIGTSTSGTLTPLLSLTLPPTSTMVSIRSRSTATHAGGPCRRRSAAGRLAAPPRTIRGGEARPGSVVRASRRVEDEAGARFEHRRRRPAKRPTRSLGP